MRIALDTNILVYAEGINSDVRRDGVTRLLRKLPSGNIYIPLQALGELFYVLVRKGSLQPTTARNVVLEWRDEYAMIETSQEVFLSGLELSIHHRMRIWDAIILSAAASADCRVLLSEDLQDGFTWNGVTVVNPFAKTPNKLLLEALSE